MTDTQFKFTYQTVFESYGVTGRVLDGTKEEFASRLKFQKTLVQETLRARLNFKVPSFVLRINFACNTGRGKMLLDAIEAGFEESECKQFWTVRKTMVLKPRSKTYKTLFVFETSSFLDLCHLNDRMLRMTMMDLHD